LDDRIPGRNHDRELGAVHKKLGEAKKRCLERSAAIAAIRGGSKAAKSRLSYIGSNVLHREISARHEVKVPCHSMCCRGNELKGGVVPTWAWWGGNDKFVPWKLQC